MRGKVESGKWGKNVGGGRVKIVGSRQSVAGSRRVESGLGLWAVLYFSASWEFCNFEVVALYHVSYSAMIMYLVPKIPECKPFIKDVL